MTRLTSIFTIFAIALAAAFPAHAGEVAVEGKGAPKLYVVKVHADWCGSCKAVEPLLVELRSKFAEKPVLFLTLDLTTEETTAQTRLLAAALGIEDALKAHNRTGLVFLYDPAGKEVTKVLTKANTLDEMIASLNEALGHPIS